MTTHVPFPALRTLSKAVFLDDDGGFISTLKLVLSSKLAGSFHTDRESAINVLAASEQAMGRERDAIGGIVAAQSHQADSPQAVSLAVQYLDDPGRCNLVGALVVDYAMPGEDGISFCERVGTPGLQRMLLTGHANDSIAVAAFNQGLIERFVPKMSEPWRTGAADIVRALVDRSAARRGEPLLACVDEPLRRMLEDPGAVRSLCVMLDVLGVQEYVLLGHPQGIVGQRRNGSLVWVQLETQESLGRLLETLDGEPDAWPGSDRALVQRVQTGSALVNTHLASQIDVPVTEVEAKVLHPAPLLIAAAFPLPDSVRHQD